MLGRRRFLVLTGGSVLLPYAHAHRLQHSTTELRWQPDAATLEVVHALHLDDALVVLAQLGEPQGELTLQAQAKLLAYVESHFKLSVDDTELTLEPVGAQIQGDYLWIYQEHSVAAPPSALAVWCSMFQAWFPEQRNQVNYAVGNTVQTRYFHEQHQSDGFDLQNDTQEPTR